MGVINVKERQEGIKIGYNFVVRSYEGKIWKDIWCDALPSEEVLFGLFSLALNNDCG